MESRYLLTRQAEQLGKALAKGIEQLLQIRTDSDFNNTATAPDFDSVLDDLLGLDLELYKVKIDQLDGNNLSSLVEFLSSYVAFLIDGTAVNRIEERLKLAKDLQTLKFKTVNFSMRLLQRIMQINLMNSFRCKNIICAVALFFTALSFTFGQNYFLVAGKIGGKARTHFMLNDHIKVKSEQGIFEGKISYIGLDSLRIGEQLIRVSSISKIVDRRGRGLVKKMAVKFSLAGLLFVGIGNLNGAIYNEGQLGKPEYIVAAVLSGVGILCYLFRNKRYNMALNCYVHTVPLDFGPAGNDRIK